MGNDWPPYCPISSFPLHGLFLCGDGWYLVVLRLCFLMSEFPARRTANSTVEASPNHTQGCRALNLNSYCTVDIHLWDCRHMSAQIPLHTCKYIAIFAGGFKMNGTVNLVSCLHLNAVIASTGHSRDVGTSTRNHGQPWGTTDLTHQEVIQSKIFFSQLNTHKHHWNLLRWVNHVPFPAL